MHLLSCLVRSDSVKLDDDVKGSGTKLAVFYLFRMRFARSNDNEVNDEGDKGFE